MNQIPKTPQIDIIRRVKERWTKERWPWLQEEEDKQVCMLKEYLGCLTMMVSFIFDDVYVYLCGGMCTCECRYPPRPEEGIRFPGAGVIDSCQVCPGN